ncbi:hypothetical protein T265_01242 [Opisthorchis viverrini]|uniref:Integrase catalytic domain-containing protein n=1 Tax=Opisthorchis viverrini TaxID=6198 RepID=A0A075A3C9_OPIVI|nr:hypothetical protein T265_01242 [Opisthorchis viverrini]KER32757.1 hypothetical protein T265_01242 [Opisthorchis viverrini]
MDFPAVRCVSVVVHCTYQPENLDTSITAQELETSQSRVEDVGWQSSFHRHLLTMRVHRPHPESNCTPLAIDNFPKDLFHQRDRQRGAVILHIIGATYMFLALAILCDDYFIPCLERICEVLNLQPDVAGATFMAAGSSAPELATTLVGVFIAKDDIGLGAVVGSADFNIMLVVSVTALFAKEIIYLNWWPLVRDCTFYLLSIIVLALVILDEYVYWYEALIFLILYGVYVAFMYVNPKLDAFLNLWCRQHPNFCPRVHHTEAEQQQSVQQHRGGFAHTNIACEDEQPVIGQSKYERLTDIEKQGDVATERSSCTPVCPYLPQCSVAPKLSRPFLQSAARIGQVSQPYNNHPFGNIIKATQPFERVSIDFKGPLPSTSHNKYLLTMIDEYSRFPFAFACTDVSSSTVIKCFNQLFSLFGMPSYVHSDRGGAFMSGEVQTFLHDRGVATSRTTPYNPRGNGQVERLNGTLWKSITLALKTQQRDITEWECLSLDLDEPMGGPKRVVDIMKAANDSTSDLETQICDPEESWFDTCFAPLRLPKSQGVRAKFRFFYALSIWPLRFLLCLTVPDVRKAKWRRSSLSHWISFVMCCVWIGLFTIVMMWMISIIGVTFHIPDTIMGLTFIAAGSSVPDAIASILVVREGEGDMAVSNAVGSNVFDILVCMGLPWFLKCLIAGAPVIIYSKGLVYAVLTLFTTVLFLLGVTHLNRWRLTKPYGLVLLLGYFVVLVFCSCYELNLFGTVHLPECPLTE